MDWIRLGISTHHGKHLICCLCIQEWYRDYIVEDQKVDGSKQCSGYADSMCAGHGGLYEVSRDASDRDVASHHHICHCHSRLKLPADHIFRPDSGLALLDQSRI